MKVSSKIFTISAIACLLTLSSYGQTPVSLKYAIQQKLVSVSFEATGSVQGLNASSHIGKCLAYKIKNLTKKDLKLKLNAGYLFEADSDHQPLLYTDNNTWLIAAGAFVTGYLNAMCAALVKSSPMKNLKYLLGEMTTGVKKKFADFVATKNYQNSMAQDLLWAITDNSNISNSFKGNSQLEKDLRQFAQKEAGIKMNGIPEAPRASALNSIKPKLSLRLENKFIATDSGALTLKIVDMQGNVRLVNPTGQVVNRGEVMHTIWVSSTELPPGDWVVLYLIEGREQYRREFHMSSP